MFMDIVTNQIVVSVIVASVICQIWKFIDKSFRKMKLDWYALVATGGMPSSHSTFVCSLAVSVGLVEGFLSTIFFLAAGFAVVVVRDAFGVRHAVDTLARSVNEIIRSKRLGVAELLKITGHTPVQAVVGVIVGIAVTVILHFAFYYP
ncbi:divergent PAP2 family protein [Candidatus Woesearchaeota archaeon]|nr:divergent PAP2 family protein [Candidatus Woesearchaeota archaeon]